MPRDYNKHGMTKTRLYTAWQHMKDRCLNEKAINYKDYGGRGIGICTEWMKFENFAEWSLTHGYSDTLSIDRIDNDKGYYPENCRWATWIQQRANQRPRKSKSGYVGVRVCGPDYYVAYVCHGRKYHYIGRYKTAVEASEARRKFIEDESNGAL